MEVNSLSDAYWLQAGTNKTSSSASETDEFQDTLQMLMMGMSLQGATGSTSDGSSASMSDSLSAMMAPLLMELLEKVMAYQADSANGLSSAGSSFLGSSNVQINQFDAETEVGGDGVNANCGPTSLTMSLHSLGLSVFGEQSGDSAGRAVELARKSMVSDSGRDGVDASGKRSESENNTYTNFNDLMRGAQRAGASATMIGSSSDSIASALTRGAKVLVSGTFANKSSLPWTGDRGVDNNSAPGNAREHIVAVTGYDAQRDLFLVNDPARNTPVYVTGAALESFMSGNAGAMAVSRA